MATKRKSTRRGRQESPNGSTLLMMELQQIHSAENQLARELPRFAKVVESGALRRMMEQRMKQGERLIEDVSSALDALDGGARGAKNSAAEGLIKDTREHVQRMQPGAARDAVLTAGIQKTEHYCIAAWGTARSLAQATGQRNAVKAMERALKEGKTLDERLSAIAERELTPTLLGADTAEEQPSRSRGRRRSRRKQTRH